MKNIECYPASYETAMYAYESDDDEEDITKMGITNYYIN